MKGMKIRKHAQVIGGVTVLLAVFSFAFFLAGPYAQEDIRDQGNSTVGARPGQGTWQKQADGTFAYVTSSETGAGKDPQRKMFWIYFQIALLLAIVGIFYVIRRLPSAGGDVFRLQLNELNELQTEFDDCIRQEKYAAAAMAAEQSLQIAKKIFGARHAKVAKAARNLAQAYCLQGVNDGYVEALLKEALSIFEGEGGPDHPNVAKVLADLAQIYSAQAKFAEAESCFRRVIDIHEKANGRESLPVAAAALAAARFYNVREKYAEAEPLYRRAMAIYENESGHCPAKELEVASLEAAHFFRKIGNEDEAERLKEHFGNRRS